MDRPPHRLGAERVVEVHAGHDGLLSLSSLLLPALEPLPPDCPDWPLLTPNHAVVPFLGRDEERAALRTWADDPSPLSIAVLTGEAGMGKTRLAGELCTELTAAGWDAGFLPDPHRATGLDVLRPTLLALDHPEPSAAAIGELVRHLAGQKHRPRVRILLLSRESTGGEWWRRLAVAAGALWEGLNTITVQLGRRPLTAAERVAHAAAAMRAFAPPRAVLPDVGDPGYDDPLRLQLAALMRLRGDDVAAGEELVSRFLTYELAQWMTVWPEGHEPVDAATARQAVALVTLTTPTREELHELLSAVARAHDRRLALGDWLTRLFPGSDHISSGEALPPLASGGTTPLSAEGGRLAPLGPEVVAEQFLAETEGLAALVLAVYDHPARTAGHLVRMLDVLRLSSERPAIRSALRSLLTGRLGELLAETAAEPSPRVGDEHGAAIQPLVISAVEALEVAAGELLGEADGGEERGMLVRSLCVYASALLGRHRAVEALAQVERAADLCDELDEPVVAAMTYAVLGATLAALGRPRDALEAIAWSQAEQDRALAEQEQALAGQSGARVEELIAIARETVAVYDELPAEGGDAAGVHTGRALAGMSLGAALALQGRHGDSVRPLGEAVAALERFAGGDPVLKSQLAKGMLMLGDALIETGRALEASVVLHRGTQVIEDDVLSAVAHAKLGFCRTELGHH